MNQLRLNGAGKDPILLTTESLKSLGSHLRGRIVTAEDESFDKTRKVWNGLIDKKPGAIIQCLGTADVMAAVKFAGKHGLRISVRSGGHNVAGSCLDENGYVIDLSAMRGVRVDPENQIARAEGGARLGDLDHETQAFGQAAPVGVVSATGVAGLTLHGGVGWLLRRHGLSIDNLLSVDVVTADGQFRRVDLDQNPDLFWAIRGGGGNFGVVTSFEFKIHSVGPEVWMSAPVYPLDRAAEVVAAFRDYMEAAPDELMGIAVYWSAPEAHGIPEKLRGSPVVILLSCYTGPLDEAEKITAPLRNIGDPIADLGETMRFTDAQKFLDADYPDGKFYYWKSIYLDKLDAEAIEVLSKHAASRPSPISSIDVWALGRAMSRVPSTDTAFFKRDAPYMIGIEANWDDRKDTDANIEWARRVFEAMKKFTREGHYLNFPGFFEEQDSLLQGAYGPNLNRLQSIKKKFDPMNLFAGAINIQPEGPANN